MKPKTRQKEKNKSGKPSEPASDTKLIIVLGAAFLLALFIIGAIMLTTPTT
jgi:hypothetical protein